MELSLRLDMLGMVEVRYLRGRERFRDWPPFLLFAASRQARIMSYLPRETLEQLHAQILAVEDATGLGIEDDEDDEDDEDLESDELQGGEALEGGSLEGSTPLSPAFAQALERLNEFARQRLPEGGASQQLNETPGDEAMPDEEDALEQLQEALVQMMEIIRDLAGELSTDALKLTSRFRCARADIFFTRAEQAAEGEIDEGEEEDEENNLLELALILRLYEEGRAKPEDLPAVELQLDVDDLERLHETLDIALEREKRTRRRRST